MVLNQRRRIWRVQSGLVQTDGGFTQSVKLFIHVQRTPNAWSVLTLSAWALASPQRLIRARGYGNDTCAHNSMPATCFPVPTEVRVIGMQCMNMMIHGWSGQDTLMNDNSDSGPQKFLLYDRWSDGPQIQVHCWPTSPVRHGKKTIMFI